MIGLGSDKNLSLGGELQEGFQLGQGWKENEICVKRKDFHILFSAHIRVYHFSLRHMRAAILGCWRGWLHLHPLSERSVCSKITLWAQERWSMDLLKWPAKQENMKHSKTEVVQIATEGQVTWHIYVCCVPQDFLRSPYLMKTQFSAIAISRLVFQSWEFYISVVSIWTLSIGQYIFNRSETVSYQICLKSNLGSNT